ncbi:PorP/SprF family type IX secretion system membrane protein [Fluviicola taffensis]|uniref:Putative membrane protein n=1 Tax=Fluviicola taffensis (strain DSM 16823 / NCIMB 13979 / RW262) TaxID=755732 RepID=F2IFS4_FLUTR|nr:PorP/SprF family type IX secretion system membrane protein [Fluviicola taffensis]AEA42532.1 putative membrane protein [Fluviicola taffensis DSM 16823]
MNLTIHPGNPGRLFITLISGLILSINSIAQEEPRSSFFWNQYMHTNPAMTGAIYKHHANVQWRNQWTRINGAPTTLWTNYAAKIDKINSGIGASYEYDVIGYTKSHSAMLSYAYHIPIKKMFLSIGASGGIKTLKTDFSKLVFSQIPDPAAINRTYNPVFQCDFGIALHSEKWNVGLSGTQLNGGSFRDSIYSIKQRPQIWLFADYAFGLGEKWKLTPRLQTYVNYYTIGTIIALEARFKENFWFGCTSSFPDFSGMVAIGPMIGYDILGKFRVGYTYEFYLNNHVGSITNNGTHEIVLSYQLK